MLNYITHTFPNSTADSLEFFKQLVDLLNEPANAYKQEDGSLILTPSQPTGALPVTTFMQSDVPFPQLNFGSGQELSLNIGNLRINPEPNLEYDIDNRGFEQIISRQDSLGTYFELRAPSLKIYRLPMNELTKRLKGHILRVDHTGLNIPSVLITKERWEQFTHQLAEQTNLYKYPTNNIWPFILPATQDEHETDITNFPLGREPKFELVYDKYSYVPTIQIDIVTHLTRQEAEQLFPKPYSFSFRGFADFFRTVYVHHEWLGLAIRFDIRFKCDQPGDWQTGKWLVEDGGRLK